MSSKGTIYVVTGPSGAGKGTVLGRVFATTDKLYYSVSATTRPPRVNERHGVNYYFCTMDQMKKMIDKGQLLEYAEYVDNFYGTPAKPVDEMLDIGCDVVLEIETEGAFQVKEKRPEAVLVFVTPPGFEILEERLRKRGTDSDSRIEKRLEKARDEYKKINLFDYVVVNDDIDSAADELRSIIIANRCKSTKRSEMFNNTNQ